MALAIDAMATSSALASNVTAPVLESGKTASNDTSLPAPVASASNSTAPTSALAAWVGSAPSSSVTATSTTSTNALALVTSGPQLLNAPHGLTTQKSDTSSGLAPAAMAISSAPQVLAASNPTSQDLSAKGISASAQPPAPSLPAQDPAPAKNSMAPNSTSVKNSTSPNSASQNSTTGHKPSNGSAYNVTELRGLLGSKGTEKYEIPTRLPHIDFEIPPSWGGYQPISSKPNETRQLFFWMFPATGGVGQNDLVVWLNGGPGCSSLSGVLTEEGPIKLNNLTRKAEFNKYSWTNLTNMLWVDQPAGTGFSRGSAKNQSMEQVADEFNGFLLSLYKAFPKLQGKKLWLAGESYAGKFIPFMADRIYKNQAQNEKAGIHLQGINMIDPFFMDNTVGKELPAMQFARQHYKSMNITDKDMRKLEAQAKKIGIADYVEKNLNYPPKGRLPVPRKLSKSNSVYSSFKKMAKKANPCFSPFYVISSSPCPLNPVGQNVTSEKAYPDNFFNNVPFIKPMIHADNKTFLVCSNAKNFEKMKDNMSNFPLHTVLPSVIEKSKRSLIQHGTYDYVMIANGSALAIQNMTWAGKQGFRYKPNTTLLVDGQKAGTFHSERKLSFATVDGASHMIPAYKPKPAYKLLQYLLGQIPEEDLSKE